MPRLLLVEDNPVHARLVFGMLADAWRDAGEQVAHVRTFADAIEVLRSTPPECVLLDLVLPDAEGLEAVYEVRQVAPSVPVVVMSAHDDETLAVRAVDEGAEDYLVKGKVDAHGLRRAVIYAIERSRRNDRPDPAVIAAGDDDLGTGTAFFDLDGTIHHADRVACRLFDRKPHELADAAQQLIHPDDAAQLSNAMGAVHAFGQGPAELPLRLRLSDGSERRVVARASLLYGGDGSPSGFAVQMAAEMPRGGGPLSDDSSGTGRSWEVMT